MMQMIKLTWKKPIITHHFYSLFFWIFFHKKSTSLFIFYYRSWIKKFKLKWIPFSFFSYFRTNWIKIALQKKESEKVRVSYVVTPTSDRINFFKIEILFWGHICPHHHHHMSIHCRFPEYIKYMNLLAFSLTWKKNWILFSIACLCVIQQNQTHIQRKNTDLLCVCLWSRYTVYCNCNII